MADHKFSLQNIGKENVEKGFVRDGIVLLSWDGLKECDGEECPIYDRCTYVRQKFPDRCEVQRQYVLSVLNNVFERYRYLDEASILKVGLQIVPLYSQLAQLKIVELSLRICRIERVTDKGKLYIHPVYKEIRETVKTLNAVWRDLGLNMDYPPPVDPDGKPGEHTGDTVRGDSSYYRKLKDPSARKGVVR